LGDAEQVQDGARQERGDAVQACACGHSVSRELCCDRRIILTYEESDTITDDFGTIEVMPLWKWILGQ